MDLIKNAIEDIAKKAIEKHGYYNSYAEYYAILKEETEELAEEIAIINKQVKYLWGAVRKNDNFDIYNNNIENHTNKAIYEALQVLSVIEKYKLTIKNWNCEDCENFTNDKCNADIVPEFWDKEDKKEAVLNCKEFKKR